MAENYDTDKLIRQKFENFEPEPPVEVWENVRKKISGTPPPSSPGIILPMIIVVSLLVFLGGLIHHFTATDPASGLEAVADGGSILQSASTSGTGSTTISDPSIQKTAYEEQVQPVTFSSIIQGEPVTAEKTTTSPIPVRAPFDKQPPAGEKKINPSGKMSGLFRKNTTRREGFKPGLRQAFLAGELSYADAVRYDLSLRDINKLNRFRERSKDAVAAWSIALAFNPEVTTYNGKDANYEKTISFNLSLLPQVTFNRFFIRSGINYRMTNDRGNASIAYNQFLGTYEDVYLVTFDSTENGVIPTYHTETVSVYDTIDHYYVSETKARYSYLEVPLLLGYRINAGKFTMFANAGPAASFLVGKHIPQAGSPDPEARIVNVDYQVPVRTNVNWQLQAGLGFDYRMTPKVSLGLEPTFRYALKPEYELPAGSSVKAFSYGVRLGIRYNF